MRHLKKGKKLNRTSSHRTAMLRNLATALVKHERIQTTQAKAKEVGRFIERLLTMGKAGDVSARRLAFRDIREHSVLKKLFGNTSSRFSGRQGGYTRIIRNGFRRGDNAPMAIIELVGDIPASEAPAEKTE